MLGMFYQTSFNNTKTKVVTVNGITYTAWDTLNVTNMRLHVLKVAFNNGINQ
jgi:hypothetical protein